MVAIGKCYCCDKPVYRGLANGVIRRSGHRYYCQSKECQQMFNDDAGDPPDERYD